MYPDLDLASDLAIFNLDLRDASGKLLQLLFLFDDKRIWIRIWIGTSDQRIRIREVKKNMDSQHGIEQ
jgi:hypothetical protein